MKWLVSVLYLAVMVADVGAATRCVKLDATLVPSTSSTNGSLWTVEYANGGVISGVGTCIPWFNGLQSYYGAVSDILNPIDNVTVFESITLGWNENNDFCLCKMLAPVESMWLSQQNLGEDVCHRDCAETCARFLLVDEPYREKMFQNLK